MFIRSVIILTIITTVACQYCNQESAIAKFKSPTYDFSIKLLYRIAQETGYHFAFSPISTWLQLTTLGLGAKNETENEIQQVTKYHKHPCYEQKYFKFLDNLNEKLNLLSKRSCIMVINKFINVENSFKRTIRDSKICKIMLLNFRNMDRAAEEVNRVIEKDTNGVITRGVYFDDFNRTLILMTDSGFFESDWQMQFNPADTREEPFYSHEYVEIGKVAMMSQLNYFELTDVPQLKAQVLELPFNAPQSISMLIVLPNNGRLEELFYSFQDIQMQTILNPNKQKKKLVYVKLPRFKIRTELDNIPEILYDMGIEKIFYPELSDFSAISYSKLYVSLMTQIAEVKVTEKGASAGHVAQFLVDPKQKTDFIVNRPFAYLIVDKLSDIVLYAGMYSRPSTY